MTVQATFIATLIDEWVRAGVRHAVISPGSRSSALTVALAGDDRLTIHMRLDERSAGFFAIGLARSSGSPVVVVTTSGTAAAELHAAVVEADQSNVPIICATTDRPIELHGINASQTIEQVGLFGASVRLAVNFGVAEADTQAQWRSMASSIVVAAKASPKGPGPVQVNLALREPFVGVDVGELPPARPNGAPWHLGHLSSTLSEIEIELLCAELVGKNGIIVAGDGATPDGDPTPILALADVLSWPVIADPRAFPREVDARVICFADSIFRSELACKKLRPEVILHLGNAHLSKSFATFLASLRGTDVIDLVVNRFGVVSDPDRMAHHYFAGEPSTVVLQCAQYLQTTPHPSSPTAWRDSFAAADDGAATAITDVVRAENDANEPGVLRDVFAAVPPRSTIVVAASMPARDLEWFAAPRPGAPKVIFNGGVNGIDGVVSTILGVAAGISPNGNFAAPVTAVVGDLTFFHDLAGLLWGELEKVPKATIVVIDNRGGGIFSFLEQARVLDQSTYERTMATPQRSDPAEVARALGCHVVEADKAPIAQLVNDSYQNEGISIIVVRTNREENTVFHAAINQKVVAAVDAALTK